MVVRPDSTIPPVAAIDAARATSAIQIGGSPLSSSLSLLAKNQFLRAEIVSNDGNGQFTVQVGNTSFRVSLPPDSQIGQKVVIQFNPAQTQTTPQTQAEQAVQTGQAQASQPAQITARLLTPTPAGNAIETSGSGQTKGVRTDTTEALIPTAKPAPQAAPLTPEESSVTRLSQISKLITSIIQQSPANAGPVVARQPVLSQAAELSHPAAVAEKLQQQLGRSGLFYESHLAEWTKGAARVEDIRQEPQARLPLLTQTTDGQTSPISKDVLQIIHQQLNTLENQSVQWRGEWLPGQKMDWLLERKGGEAGGQPGGQETTPYWNSKVTLNLPQLGQISATFQLYGTQMNISIHSANAGSEEKLQQHIEEFRAALAEAGINTGSIQVSADHESGKTE